jgi:hypothetical protein
MTVLLSTLNTSELPFGVFKRPSRRAQPRLLSSQICVKHSPQVAGELSALLTGAMAVALGEVAQVKSQPGHFMRAGQVASEAQLCQQSPAHAGTSLQVGWVEATGERSALIGDVAGEIEAGGKH